MRWLALLLVVAVVRAKEPPPQFRCQSPDGRYRFSTVGRGYEFHDGEQLLAKGTLQEAFSDARVAASVPGVVLLQRKGDTLALLVADGTVRWTLPLEEAIPGGLGGAPRENFASWPRAWWIDEPRGKVVVVARNGTLSDIDLGKGAAATARQGVILDALLLPGARNHALEVAVELETRGLREAAEKLLADPSLAPVSRLLAAVAVEKCGGTPVTREIWDAALATGVTPGARQAVAFAGKHVADLALVTDAAQRKDEFAYDAVKALADRGAVDALADIPADGSVETGLRVFAAGLLARQAPGKALETIDKAMEDADVAQGSGLLNEAIRAGLPDLERRLQHHEALLLKILDKGTGNLPWLAGYFKGRPTSEAVQPLLRALHRNKANPDLRKKLIAALKPCSGEDFGDDADAWIEALAKK